MLDGSRPGYTIQVQAPLVLTLELSVDQASRRSDKFIETVRLWRQGQWWVSTW